MEIAGSKERAAEEEKDWIGRENQVRIYTDGSDCEGGVGAAAILLRGNRKKILRGT